MDEILSDLIPVMRREFPKRPPTNENLFEYFMSRVRRNLHVILCFSPVGEKFRNRAYRRSTHVTPKSYLSFIQGYKTIYKEKRSEVQTMANRMNTGLQKLKEASESVAALSKELEVKEKELQIANDKADMVSRFAFLTSVFLFEGLRVTSAR
ncbi:hypothetical protein GOODEAATRI_030323 [Goodea atripinnis]|uniref:Dynein heavy chain AAA module D4 domain-containing protein n=1 Tax=Goodea atripinnis TaxID=208336 RepID=A0ABV0PSZ5_9TELE